jgi:integrase
MATFDKVQNKSGTVWRFQIAIKGPTGTRRASGTRTTKAEAVIAAAEREAEIRRDVTTGIEHGRTVDEAFRRYEKDVSAHKAGRRWEEIRLSFIRRIEIDGVKIGDMRLCDVTSDTLGRMRDHRLKVDKVAGATVSRDLNLLSHVFSTAVKEWKWIATSPTTDVRRPKEAEGRDRLATDDEIERICFALGFDIGGEENARDTTSQRIAVMLLFAIETAMRAGEMCQLEPSWIRGNVVHLPAAVTKTRTRRDVPLSNRAIELLSRLPPALAGGTVFGCSTDTRDVLFRRATNTAAIEGLTFHDSRHLAITRLSKKLDILALARMVGHRDLRQLQVYYNESAADMAPRLN